MEHWQLVALMLTTSCLSVCANGQDSPPADDQSGLPDSANVQRFVLPRDIDPNFNTRIGDRLRLPEIDTGAAPAQEALQCRFTCSAVFPGQPELELLWEEPAIGAAQSQERQLRLDISGTSTGFMRANFGSVPIARIPSVTTSPSQAQVPPPNANLPVPQVNLPDTTAIDPQVLAPNVSAIEPQINLASLTAQPQVLLQIVRDGLVVERNPALPVFPSNQILQQSIAERTLPDDVLTEVQTDLLTGSLPQIRLTGTFAEPVGSAVLRHVQMQGLQPGTTYRFRLVMEEDDEVETANAQVCRVPVCPVDYDQ